MASANAASATQVAFVYGDTSFLRIRKDHHFFADNSMLIRKIENIVPHVLICRPPRFGKSVFLDMMERYYDEHKSAKDRFTALFGSVDSPDSLAIGKAPTGKQNTYKVLSICLTIEVSRTDTAQQLSERFHRKVNRRLQKFRNKYGMAFAIDADFAITLDSLAEELNQNQNERLLVLVDEYDRFANKLLVETDAGDAQDKLAPLVAFFECLKTLDLSGIESYRTVTVGIMPLSIGCFSSWNGFRDLTLSKLLADDFGLHVEHVQQAVMNLTENTAEQAKILDVMQELLNGYRFYGSNNALFNPQYATHFLQQFREDEYIRELVLKKATSDWSTKDHAYIIAEGDQNLHPDHFYEIIIQATTCTVELLCAISVPQPDVEKLRTVRRSEVGNRRLVLGDMFGNPEKLLWFMYFQGFLTIEATVDWTEDALKLRLPNKVAWHAYSRVVVRRIESSENRMQLFWGAPDRKKLYELLWRFISVLDTPSESARITEMGLQYMLERALRDAADQHTTVRAHYITDTKKEIDLLIHAASPRKQVVVIELKRLKPDEIAVNNSMRSSGDAATLKAVNDLIGDEQKLGEVRISGSKGSDGKSAQDRFGGATTVRDAVENTKQSVREKAEALARMNDWHGYTIYKFIVIQIVKPLLVEQVGG